MTKKFLGNTRLVCKRLCFTQASYRQLKMQNCLLKCDLIAWSFLICTSVSCMCCLRLRERSDFSHGLRKCRGVKEVVLLEYVGRLIFLSFCLSLSHSHTLSWKVYFCRNRICLHFLFLGLALVPPLSL